MDTVIPRARGDENTATRGLPDLAQLRQAIDASGEIVFMTDREDVFTFVNATFERRYG
jgi:PAS domain-containing protein